MDFQTFASKETSALIKQLLATQSGAALQQFMRFAKRSMRRRARSPLPRIWTRRFKSWSATHRAAEAEIRRIREDANAALEVGRADLHAQHAERESLGNTRQDRRRSGDSAQRTADGPRADRVGWAVWPSRSTHTRKSKRLCAGSKGN